MEAFDREVCKRLPLAEAVLRLFDFVCDEDPLRTIYQQHRGRSYSKVLQFPTFVQLIADALLQHQGSARKSFQSAQSKGDLETSLRAPYDKLARVPLSLSVGFLSETTASLKQIFPPKITTTQVPASLRNLAPTYYDGKKIKHVAKRLKALRKVRGHVLGGKLVVAQSLATGMALAMGACEDGETADPPLVPDVLSEVRRTTPQPCLHVGDRAFCDLKQMDLFTQREGDHFLVRWNRKVHFHRDESRPSVTGTDRRGLRYTEDWGWVGQEGDPRRRYVRRIHLQRPGDAEDVIVLTDLLDSQAYPADDLLEVYLQRWGIERMFQKVTEVFALKTLIGSSPRATVFQASFCFVIYNMIQVLRAYIAEGQQMQPREISLENLFYDVKRQLIAWTEVLPTETTVAMLREKWTAPQFAAYLRKLLGGQWSESWRKAPSNTHRTPPANTDYLKGGHNSVYRLVQLAQGGT